MNNFAIQSGVIQASNDGYYEFYRSYITDNYAYMLSISEIFIVTRPPLFSNSTIFGNLVLTRNQILNELDSCDLLCFLSDIYTQYLKNNLNLLNGGSIEASIQCISGALTIANNTYVTDQPVFINSYLSEVIISYLHIYSITSESRVMSLVESHLILNNSDVTNINSTSSGDFISLSFQSVATINNVIYSNSTTKFMVALLSSVQIASLDFDRVVMNNYILSFVDCINVSMRDINQITNTRGSMILFSGSFIDSINNLTISGSNDTGLYIVRSNVFMMDKIQINNAHQSIRIEKSHIDIFQNSQLSFSGSEQIVKGGAIYVENSNMTMTNITFDSNTAQIGGAVSISCDVYDS